jgi:Sds3-like
MAMSPSPQISPSIGAAQRPDGIRSDTPPAVPLSKRDKRRTQLLDRLNEITTNFNNNKDQYYRNQLQAIQIDTGLILHADPYRDDPLSDFGDEVQEMICNANNSNPQAMMAILKKDVSSIAGKIYSEFANEVNDAMERRDSALTMHQVNSLLELDSLKPLTSIST